MRHFIAAALVALFHALGVACAQAQTQSEQKQNYLGQIWPPLPQGCEQISIGSVDWPKTSPPESIPPKQRPSKISSLIRCGDVQIYCLGLKTDSSPARWEVKDVLILPPLPPLHSVSDIDCTLDGRSDIPLIAVARWASRGAGMVADLITHAWQIQEEPFRFEPVATARVACGYDEDRD